MNLRGAKPINDDSVKSFILSQNCTKDLYNKDIQYEFIDSFFKWINSSQLNNLKGLELFTNQKIVTGTTQTFDHWYWRHKNRRFRFYRGEFMYHSAVLKNGGSFEYINDKPLEDDDAVIISVPFSDYGVQHPNLEHILNNCDLLNIPVLLDFAYFPCTKNINLDLSKHKSVETVTFSISKAFYGAEFLRVGMRLEKQNIDDGVDVFNSVEIVNRITLSIALKLIENYDVDYNWNMYKNNYNEVCDELNLVKTDCIMFGLGDQTYEKYNRGSEVNRVCISELIGKKINDSSK